MGDIINAKQKFFEKYSRDVLNKLYKEIELLKRWFYENYKSYTLDVTVEFNTLRRYLSIKSRIMTPQKELLDVKDSFFREIRIEEKSFSNNDFMKPFLHVFNEKYRDEINRLIRNDIHLKESEVA